MDSQLARGLSNPYRVRVLELLHGGSASRKQLAAIFDDDLSRVAYHVAVLQQAGCVQPVEEEQGNKRSDRFFELTPLALSGHLTRRQVPASVRGYASASVLQTIMDRGVASLEAGTLDKREDSHLSCMSVRLDDQGWQQVAGIMGEALERVAAAHRESAQRLAEADESGIETTVAIASFESAAVEPSA